MVKVLPEPVTPNSTWSRSPASTPAISSLIADGWSPLGSYSDVTVSRREKARAGCLAGTNTTGWDTRLSRAVTDIGGSCNHQGGASAPRRRAKKPGAG